MVELSRILEQKGQNVVCIQPGATVKEAAVRMNQHQIGALVVVKGWQVVGIFTERDVLRRVIVENRDPEKTAVEQVMTENVICCHANGSLEEARTLLKTRRIRHLPVLDTEDRLIGMISIGDLNAWALDGQEVVIRDLHEYIYGRT